MPSFWNDTEEYVLWQEGQGPDPNGEPGCFHTLIQLVVFFACLVLFFACGSMCSSDHDYSMRLDKSTLTMIVVGVFFLILYFNLKRIILFFKNLKKEKKKPTKPAIKLEKEKTKAIVNPKSVVQKPKLQYNDIEGGLSCSLVGLLPKSYYFRYDVKDKQIIKKGDCILRMSSSKISESILVLADFDGVISIPLDTSELHMRSWLDPNCLLFNLYHSMDLLQEHDYPNKMSIEFDDFNKKPTIACSIFGGNVNGFCFGSLYVRFYYYNGKHEIDIDYDSKSLNIGKSCVLRFLLEDGTVLSFANFTKPMKYDDNKESWKINKTMSARMRMSDIVAMSKYNVTKWQIVNENGTVVHTEDYPPFADTPELYQMALKKYMNSYLSLYRQIQNNFDIDDAEESEPMVNAPSYVCLMLDSVSHSYKIGITNDAALKNDNPTILLLCCKKYPNRAIGEAIVSALQNTYLGKRIKGEWYDLSQEDVNDIRQTLV